MAADILVVDDEQDIRDLVAGILEDEGYSVRTAADSDQALAAIRERRPSILVQDIWMQGGGLDGLELLDLVKSLDAELPVIMISGHGNIETPGGDRADHAERSAGIGDAHIAPRITGGIGEKHRRTKSTAGERLRIGLIDQNRGGCGIGRKAPATRPADIFP